MRDLRPILLMLLGAACPGDTDPTLTQDPSDPISTSDANATGPVEPTTGGTSEPDDTTAAPGTSAPDDTTTTGTPDTTGPDPTTAGPTSGDDGVTVHDIQMGTIAEQTIVELSGVVVTSPVSISNKGDGTFYIAEPPGGEYSGIEVFVIPDVVTVLTAEDKLPKPGDVLDLTAQYAEFYDNSQLILLYADDLDITGTGAVPEPANVAAADIATLGAKAESYEGCLVQVEGATVTTPVEQYGEFEVDDALIVDDLFFLPNPGPKPPVGTQFTALVGLLAYHFDESKLSPRACDDLQGWDLCGI
jgi:hypothetical protein